MRAWRNGRRAGLRNQFFRSVGSNPSARTIIARVDQPAESAASNPAKSPFKSEHGHRYAPFAKRPRHHAYIVTFRRFESVREYQFARFVAQQAERCSDMAEAAGSSTSAERTNHAPVAQRQSNRPISESMQVQFLTGAPRFARRLRWLRHAAADKRGKLACETQPGQPVARIPRVQPEWRGSGLLTRAQVDRNHRNPPHTSDPSGKGGRLLICWLKAFVGSSPTWCTNNYAAVAERQTRSLERRVPWECRFNSCRPHQPSLASPATARQASTTFRCEAGEGCRAEARRAKAGALVRQPG